MLTTTRAKRPTSGSWFMGGCAAVAALSIVACGAGGEGVREGGSPGVAGAMGEGGSRATTRGGAGGTAGAGGSAGAMGGSSAGGTAGVAGGGAGGASGGVGMPADAGPGTAGRGADAGSGTGPGGTGGSPSDGGRAEGGGSSGGGDAGGASACGDPPAPPLLTDAPLDAFISGHIKFNGAAPDTSLRPLFRQWAAAMGGDVFLANLLRRWPRYSIAIRPSSGFAQAGGGSVDYNLSAWNSAPNRRLPTLIHENMHNVDNGFNPTVMRLFAAAKADSSKRWDTYPFGLNVPAEYMASGTEWVILNEAFNANERKRARLKRMDPEFYCHLVNEFIPKVLYAPGAAYSGR